MKTIVTHMSPDLDAIASAWLIKRYMPGWEKANIEFVAASKTLGDEDPDANPDIIHVDTGYGQFDHHQHKSQSSATELVYQHLVKNFHIKSRDVAPLERMVRVINDIDNFQEAAYPNANADIYEFCLHQLIYGLKGIVHEQHEIVILYMQLLDAVLMTMKNKVRAEEEMSSGYVFETRWGRSIAFESRNEETMKIALKSGYELAVRLDPKTGFLKIKSFPRPANDLGAIYAVLKERDTASTWHLVGNNHIILNGSSLNPDSRPTTLQISQVVEILKRIE